MGGNLYMLNNETNSDGAKKVVERQEIFIEPEYVIVNLIKADRKKYLTVSRLFQFVVYLRQQLSEQTDISLNEVIFDISFDSIERTVRYHDKVFDLIGDTIIIKNNDLPLVPIEVEKFLPKYIQGFAEKYAA